MPDNEPETKIFAAGMFEKFACAVFFFIAAGIVFLFEPPLGVLNSAEVAGNLKYLMSYAEAAAAGLLPYADVQIEYPPLAALWLWALGPFSGSFETYRLAFSGSMLVWAFAGFAGVWKTSDLLKRDRAVYFISPHVTLAALYLAGVLAVGQIGVVSFDYVPAALLIWSVAAHLRGRGAASMILLAAGCGVKVFPAVALPFLVFDTYRREGPVRAAAQAFLFIAAIAVVFGVPYALAPGGMAESFNYHFGRGVEIGSVYGAVLMAAKAFGLEAAAVFNHGSWNVDAGGLSAFLAGISTPVTLLLLVLSFVFFAVRHFYEAPGKNTANAEPEYLVNGITAAVVAFIIGFKVGSPQFLCWALPLVAAASLPAAGRSRFYMFVSAGILGQAVFPWYWEELIFGNPGAAALLVAKHVLIIALFASLLASFTRRQRA